MLSSSKNQPFVFFGADSFSVTAAERLFQVGWRPALVVIPPNRPRGRGLLLGSPALKKWALGRRLDYFQPEKLDAEAVNHLCRKAVSWGIDRWPFFLVASYGKIIPPAVLALPRFGCLNIHPSLLPRYRGPSPIQSAILSGDNETGATIMLMDEKLDHGPILIAKNARIKAQNYLELRERLAMLGAELFLKTIGRWLDGEISPQPQREKLVVYTAKIKKEDGLVDLATEDPVTLDRKFRAYSPWPGVYFFTGGRRIKITQARLEKGKFVVDSVIPESGKEMTLADFQRGFFRRNR